MRARSASRPPSAGRRPVGHDHAAGRAAPPGRPAPAPRPCRAWSAGSWCPAVRSWRTSCQASRRAAGSNPVVGSSRNSSSGWPIRPRARSRRRFWPPDSVRTLRRSKPGEADEPDDLGHAQGRRVVAGVAGDGLAHGQVRLDRDVLQDQPGPLAQLASTGPIAWVKAEHFDRAAIAGPESLQDLQRGGLAGPVRPEQGDDLALLDAKADVAHGLHRAVALAQPGDGQLRTHWFVMHEPIAVRRRCRAAGPPVGSGPTKDGPGAGGVQL